jgi:hypothetical protein
MMLRAHHPIATGLASAILFAALAIAAGDAGAKGKRSGSSSSAKSSGSSKHDDDKGGGFSPNITIRQSNSSSSSGGTQSPATGFVPISPATGGAAAGTAAREPSPIDQEEAERRAARIAAAERERAEKEAAARAAAEAERERADRLAAERAAQRAAEEKAEAARQAAAAEKKRQEAAAVASDVDRVLQRAYADYPVLKTPEGAPLLQQILARQKVLEGRGLYPSVALVEAVADHAHALAPRQKEASMVPAAGTAAPATPAKDPRAMGNCRWVTPTRWACEPGAAAQ